MRELIGSIGFFTAFVISLQSGNGIFGSFIRALFGWLYVIFRIATSIDFNILDKITQLLG